MKKLKQGLLLAVLLLLGAYVTIPLIKQQRENWRYDELNELYNSTGYDYLYTESIPDFDSNDLVMLGAFQDGDGYKLVTACVPAEGEPALYESPLFRAETGDPATEVWYGIGGIEANPQLILMLKEQDPSLPGSGTGRSRAPQSWQSPGYSHRFFLHGSERPARQQ